MATTFWSSASSNPKRNYTYRVTINGTESFWVKAVTLPSFDVSNTEIHHFDNRYYFPGRVTWNPVSMTMVDPISVDVSALVSKTLADGDYQVPASAGVKSKTINRTKMLAGLGQVKIEVYNPANTSTSGTSNVVETWILNNAYIESAKYGDLAYDNDELKTIEMTLRYDWASHEEGSLGVAGAPATPP